MRTQDYVQLRDKQMEEMGNLEKHLDHMREWGVF